MKTVQRKIGEHEFRITRIPPFEAIELIGDLQRVFGPAIASLSAISQDRDAISQPGVLSGVLMDAAEALGRNLDGKMLRYLVAALIREDSVYIKAKGKTDFMPCNAETIQIYAELEEIVEVALLVLEHNYKDFFNKAAARIGSGLHKYNGSPKAPEPAADDKPDPLDD